MKHRDRVQTALHHEKPDRCPLQVTFTPEFAARLKKEVKLPAAPYSNPAAGGNTWALERSLDEDVLLTYVGWALCYYANDSYNPVPIPTGTSGESPGETRATRRDSATASTPRWSSAL
jgi:hypothetical protein